MNCRFCNAELPEEEDLCPNCGKVNEAEPEETVIAEQPDEAPAMDAEIPSEEPAEAEEAAQEQDEEVPAWKKPSVIRIVIAAVCALAIIAALALAVLHGMGIDIGPRENNVQYRDSYTVEDAKAVSSKDKVVATLGDRTLTNGELQVHYWMQVYEFLEYYGNYYFDYAEPLDEQYFSEEKDLTWEQYFIDIAIESWRRYTLLTILAEEEQFTVDADTQAYLDSMAADMEELAKEYDYDSAEAMVQEDMGVGCSLENYIDYMTLRNVSLLYLEHKYEEFAPTMEQIEAYYDENKATFEESGITKGNKTLVGVRHILVRLEDGEVDSYGRVNYTDAQWETCRQQAQALLDQWKQNPTEDNFAELAKTHSEDGSASNGGLYTEVEEGQMVEEFNDWIFDASRQYGDTDLVKTVYGYHIMFFVSSEEVEGDWVEAAETQITSEKTNAMIEAAGETRPLDVDYKKIVLAENELG